MTMTNSNSNSSLRRAGAGMADVRTRSSPVTPSTRSRDSHLQKPTSKSCNGSFRYVLILCFLVVALLRERSLFNYTTMQQQPVSYTNQYEFLPERPEESQQEEQIDIHLSLNHYHAPHRPKLVPATNVTSIPPSKMKVHYHELWNHETSTIDIPEEYQNPFGVWIEEEIEENGNVKQPPMYRRPLTSLEILQKVLHGEEFRHHFEAVEAYMADQNGTTPLPSCLAPNLQATHDLAQNVVQARHARQREDDGLPPNRQRRLDKKRKTKKESDLLGDQLMLPLPILNVGYPKVGSTSLKDYFECLGLLSNHGQNGFHMQKNLAGGHKLYANHLNPDFQADAYTQLDANDGPGSYPQITLLDEFHELSPDATLVFLFRPMADWIPSVTYWNQMKRRMSKFLMPGLVLTPEQLQRNQAIRKAPDKADIKKRPIMLSDVQLAKWWCGHALHIREYVKEYPSHALIELDLYDTNGTSSLLYDLFHADADAYHDSLVAEDGSGETETGDNENNNEGGGVGTPAATAAGAPKQRPQCFWGQSNKSSDRRKKKQENNANEELKQQQLESGSGE